MRSSAGLQLPGPPPPGQCLLPLAEQRRPTVNGFRDADLLRCRHPAPPPTQMLFTAGYSEQLQPVPQKLHPRMLPHQPMSTRVKAELLSPEVRARGLSPLYVPSWPTQAQTAPFAPLPQTICPRGQAGSLDSYPGVPGPQEDSSRTPGWPEI